MRSQSRTSFSTRLYEPLTKTLLYDNTTIFTAIIFMIKTASYFFVLHIFEIIFAVPTNDTSYFKKPVFKFLQN